MLRSNWAKNVTFSCQQFFEPGSVDELREIVLSSAKVKAVGSGHCFNRIADTVGAQVSLAKFNTIDIDDAAATVNVGAGVTYTQLIPKLHAAGFGIPNLASLPHISVVGACATATHGSGVQNLSLASDVVAVELVTADGGHRTIRLGDDDFQATGVGLGALGIVARVTLQLRPTFDVRQNVYLDLPLSEVLDQFDAIMSGDYSVSLFFDWRSDRINQVWVKSVGPGDAHASYFGARPAVKQSHPIATGDATNCTPQMNELVPWSEGLAHFRADFLPSQGEELQAEYFVDRDRAAEAITALLPLQSQIAHLVHVTEIRTVRRDDFWMSPMCERDSVAIHFTWQKREEEVIALLPKIESVLSPFDVRPHWGKLFTLDAQVLSSRFPRFDDFRRLVGELDPDGKFKNDFLERHLFAK